MATIVNTPTAESDSSGSNMLVVLAVVILVVFMLVYFGRGLIGQIAQPQAPQINVPVPDQIDVNVNQPE